MSGSNRGEDDDEDRRAYPLALHQPLYTLLAFPLEGVFLLHRWRRPLRDTS